MYDAIATQKREGMSGARARPKESRGGRLIPIITIHLLLLSVAVLSSTDYPGLHIAPQKRAEPLENLPAAESGPKRGGAGLLGRSRSWDKRPPADWQQFAEYDAPYYYQPDQDFSAWWDWPHATPGGGGEGRVLTVKAGREEEHGEEKPKAHRALPEAEGAGLEARPVFIDVIKDGMARLVDFLLAGQGEGTGAGDEGNSSNPFSQPLKEAMGELKKEKRAGKAEGHNQSETAALTDEARLEKSMPKIKRPDYLFVGPSPNGSAEVTAAVATQVDLNGFEFEGKGRQYFDMSIVVGNIASQEAVALGDLNKDGVPDLIVMDRITSRVTVMMGVGANRYLALSEIFSGLGPTAAAIADFDNDGSIDIAIAYLVDSKIVLDGRGFRKFIFLPASRISGEPHAILPGDFDGDGLDDLVVLNYRDFSASIYTNQRDGTFALSRIESAALLPLSSVRLDLNNDSMEDVVFVQRLNNRISIVMQDGRDGSFRSVGSFAVSPELYLGVGDFNLDGLIDIAIATRK